MKATLFQQIGQKESFKRLLRAIDTTSEWSGKVTSWLVYAGTVALTYEVVARYGFNAPTIWAHELSQQMFAAYYALSGAYVLRQRGHIAMDLISNRLSPRGRAITDLISSILFFAFCGVLLWKGADYAWRAIEIREVGSSAWRSLVWPAKMTLPVGALLILLQGLAKFSRDLITAVTGRQYES